MAEKDLMCLKGNTVALGAVAAITGIVGKDSLKKTVAARVPGGTEEINLKAVALGFKEALMPR